MNGAKYPVEREGMENSCKEIRESISPYCQ